MHNRAKGGAGEELAVEYLGKKGYTILARNFRCRCGEIDCIAQASDGTIVFVEVKSGNSQSTGHPYFRVHQMKQKRIISVARYYLTVQKKFYHPCRFDVIAITNGVIEHMQNAFLVQ